MRTTPRHIAQALIEAIEADPSISVDGACDSAILVLKKRCPGVTPREFLKIMEREIRRRGSTASGMLIVPNEHSLNTDQIVTLLSQKTGKPVEIERKTDPELIGGAILLVDHRRIDCSIKGALAALLRACLEPLA